MTTCQNCNHDVPLDSAFCPNCGTPANHETAASNQFSDERPAWLDDPSLPPVEPPRHAETDAPWQPGGDATVVVPGAGGAPQPAGPPPAAQNPPTYVPPQQQPPTYAPGQQQPPTYVPGQQTPPAYVPGQQPGYQPTGDPTAYVPGGVGGPPAAGGPQFVAAADAQPPSRNTGKIVGVGLGVVGLLAVGFLGVRFLTGGDGAGGADSPADVATEMVEAINAQDPLALVSLLAPDELDGLDDLVESVSEYSDDLRLDELLNEDESNGDELGSIEFDIDIDDIDVSEEGDDAAIVSFELSGDIEVESGTGLFGGGDDSDLRFDSRDLEGALPNNSDAVEMIVVRIDGQWYASPMLTLGHYIVENGDLPSGDYDAIGDANSRDAGADNAVEAVEQFADVISSPDADDLAAILGGGEGRVALVFRDAIDEGFDAFNDSEVRLDVSVDATDIGDGRVDLEELTLRASDDFSEAEVRIEGDCIRVTSDGDRGDEQCISDAFELDNLGEFDTRLILNTVNEDGSTRVRLVPSIFETLGRFVGIVEDRDTLLAGTNLAVFDDATTVDPGTDIDIDFDGQLFTVHEFEIEAGETYLVSAAGDTAIDVHVDEGFGLEPFYIEYGAGLGRNVRFDFDPDSNFEDPAALFTAFDDGTVRVVTYSEIDGNFEDGDCRVFECLPTGEGSTTLRIREAGRQAVDFPQRISGDLGPGDVRVFDITIDGFQVLEIDVDGSTAAFDVRGAFPFDGVFELDSGSYELIVYNTSGDDATSYTVNPTSVR